VEFAQCDIASYLELTPDGSLCAAKSDLELVNLDRFCSSSGHGGLGRAIIKDRG